MSSLCNCKAKNVLRLAKIHEKDGKVEEAAKIMQELQVSLLFIYT